MPTVKAFPFDCKVINLSVEREATRSGGIHLSTIIRDRLQTAGIERKVKGQDFTDDERHMVWQNGFLWERMVAEYVESPQNRIIELEWFIKSQLHQLSEDAIAASGGNIVRPGECKLDGIAMTPDAINIRLAHIEEWKATGIRSTNLTVENLLQRKPEWGWQTAAYAKVFGYTKGIVRVWHFCQLPVAVTQWLIEWTTEEIDKNWADLLVHWKYMNERTKTLESH